MKSFRKRTTTVNAGSMADIAFLLLIFFLVTTTISADKGILRNLPRECPTNQNCDSEIHERNILNILVNSNNEIMINNTITALSEVKDIIKKFVDNNGSATCDYCNGLKLKTSSDHPTKTVISLKSDSYSSYETFIAIQDEVSNAFIELRTHYSEAVLKKPIEKLSKQEIKHLKQVYPFILSEVITD